MTKTIKLIAEELLLSLAIRSVSAVTTKFEKLATKLEKSATRIRARIDSNTDEVAQAYTALRELEQAKKKENASLDEVAAKAQRTAARLAALSS